VNEDRERQPVARGSPALYFVSFVLLLVSGGVLASGALSGVSFSGSYASIALSVVTLALAVVGVRLRRRR